MRGHGRNMKEESIKKYAAVLSELHEKISTDISKLKMTAYKSPEPLAFGDRLKGDAEEVFEGEPWGEKLFDCAWFKFDCEIPEGEGGELALKIDLNGELYIAGPGGSPVQGLTCKASTFCDSLGKPGKRLWPLPPELASARSFSVWADCGLNDLFGALKNGGRVACARLVRINPEVRSLYYSFEQAFDWMCATADCGLRGSLDSLLASVCRALESDFASAVAPSRESIDAFLRSSAPANSVKVCAIGHAHMDLAWLWPIRETKRKLARTFSTALALGAKYPWYVYGASQPQAYAWMKEGYPELYSRIKKAVADGSIEPLGCMWVEPDCNMTSGESFVRQIIAGLNFFREEFGASPDFFWIPDSFGYSPQLPQILARSGIRHFITQKLSWNTVNRFPHHSFCWEGIDGTRVLAHMLPEETYNSPAAPRSAIKIDGEYAQRDVSGTALMAFGIGDGGGGPGEEHLERILKNAEVPALPKIENKKVSEFLAEWSADAASFPVWRGDLYLEKHQGTLTTQGLNKLHNRRCETLLREAEWHAYVLEMLSGRKVDVDFLKPLWEEVMLYQFHDILPGSSIERVYAESCARYAEIERKLEGFISGAVAQSSRILGGSPAFNANSWAETRGLAGGRELEIPQLGYADMSGASLPEPASASEGLLENGRLRVRFDARGGIVSLVEKSSGREFADPDRPANAFVSYDDFGDAWDFGNSYRKNPSRRMALKSARYFSDDGAAVAEFEFACGKSSLFERVVLGASSGGLELEIETDWRDRRRMLRGVFPLSFCAERSLAEVAFGSYSRAPDDSTRWREARIEVPAHGWAAMEGAGMGMAVSNNGKYGWRLKDNSIELGILRCVPRPGGALVASGDSAGGAESDDGLDFADLGRQKFSLELFPYSAPARPWELSARSRRLGGGFRAGPPSQAPARAASASFVEISSPAVELAAMKPAEDGSGWVARLVNLGGEPVSASVSFMFPPDRADAADLVENVETENADLSSLAFAPHEIKTLILRYNLPK